ncbi:MAG: roadblock/LC7 domain-containing protein [Promethearchaeota archaeon]|jgi:predicted regulator of Ras-like GTPase activity (Roadblock/LC7/MglB family)
MELKGYYKLANNKEKDPKKPLEVILKKFLNRNPKYNVAAIVTNEGLPIITTISHRFDELKISTMVATLFSLSNMAIEDMILGEFKELFIKGKQGYLLLFRAGVNTIFMVTTEMDIQLKLIISECKQICEKISTLISF